MTRDEWEAFTKDLAEKLCGEWRLGYRSVIKGVLTYYGLMPEIEDPPTLLEAAERIRVRAVLVRKGDQCRYEIRDDDFRDLHHAVLRAMGNES